MGRIKSDRHAYLVMCHNNFVILGKLLEALDDKRNDIYIHIDKKTKDVSYSQIRKYVKDSQLFFIKRTKVDWGGDSQIHVELSLLKAATKIPHAYYHLLSGVDFPLKSQDAIHSFFAENDGHQFIGFDHSPDRMTEYEDRIRYYYPFQNMIGRNKGKLIAALYYFQCFLLNIQRLIHVDRLHNCPVDIKKGANWFSITHEFAIELLHKESLIRKYFYCGIGADELILQSIAFSSQFRGDIVSDDLRMIDWRRGSPYTFRNDDYEMLISCGKLFARKFDEAIDIEIVDRLLSIIRND